MGKPGKLGGNRSEFQLATLCVFLAFPHFVCFWGYLPNLMGLILWMFFCSVVCLRLLISIVNPSNNRGKLFMAKYKLNRPTFFEFVFVWSCLNLDCFS